MTNLSGFDLNLLRVLDALLSERSTVGAGRRLGLSQPAVSAALKRLRAALGDDLFFRKGQRLEPTRRALLLQPALRETLTGIESLVHGPEPFDPARSSAHFRIAGSDFFAELLMPQLADRLQGLGSPICMSLVDLVPDNHLSTLDQETVDLALTPVRDFPKRIDFRPGFRCSFSVVARRDHPRLGPASLRPGEVLPLDLFCDLGHVVFSQEGKSAAMGDAALAQVGRSRRVVMTLPVFSGVYRAVAGSDLIALLPTPLARHVAVPCGLEIFCPPFPLEIAQISIAWHRRNSLSPAHVWLRDVVADLLAPLDEGAETGRVGSSG